MTDRTAQVDWVIFLLLGFFWGSSYLFIKLAVDDFGSFTLVALRLLVGATLLWVVVRLARQQLPRDRRLFVGRRGDRAARSRPELRRRCRVLAAQRPRRPTHDPGRVPGDVRGRD